ncbi:MAG: GNAT family protein [Flavobacteriaceae bacterium]|nr:GNAT family protein [Flavobacteriaceae bacterium]
MKRHFLLYLGGCNFKLCASATDQSIMDRFMNIEITGDKIRLINTVSSDIDRIIEFEKNNKQFVHQYSKDKHIALLKDDDCLHLSIKYLDNNQLIGYMIIFGICSHNKVLEFRRITINEKGLGFGREAIRLLKQLCFEKLRFHRLWFDVYDDNDSAIKLYESEGFIKEGTLRDNIKTDNGYRSQRIYSMIENEYIVRKEVQK